MTTDLNKLAIEAEADRLSGVYLRVKMLAQAQHLDFIQAGREAVAKGLYQRGGLAHGTRGRGRQ